MAEHDAERVRWWLGEMRAHDGETWQRLVDLLDGFVWDIESDGDRIRMRGVGGALVAERAEPVDPSVAVLTVPRRVVLGLARGTVRVDEAWRDGLLGLGGGPDANALRRLADRLEMAWRVLATSPTARRIQATLTGAGGGRKERRREGARATVTVPTVTVFGAGITGLTAAHELVERGFRVQVVEIQPGVRGVDTCEVGGMARTQVVRLPTLADPDPVEPHQPRPSVLGAEPFGDGVSSMVATEPPFRLHDHIDFVPNETRVRRSGLRDSWGRDNGDRLASLIADLRSLIDTFDADQQRRLQEASAAGALHPTWHPEPRRIRILVGGHFRGVRPTPNVALRRARAVTAELVRELGADADRFEFLPEVIEDREPWSDAAVVGSGEVMRADRSDRVDLRVTEERIGPGEHGYRFFPAFYRNLFHTMKRIPLFDDKGRETGQTTFDNLVPTESVLIVPFEGHGPVEVPRRRIYTAEGIRKVLEGLSERLRFDQRDITLFEIRLFTYMTSCWQRRRQHGRTTPWRQYIGISDFTPDFRKFLLDAPQTLVAMNAEEIDTRTHGNVSVQLLLDQLSTGQRSDMTLNGPTTNAFLRPWKDYLKHHGVRFFLGELRDIVPGEGGRWVPVVGRSSKVILPHGARIGDAPVPEGNVEWMPETDYYVLALPLEAAWKVLRGMPRDRLEGDLATLRGWYDDCEDELRAELGPTVEWELTVDVPRRPDKTPVGPFRDFAGIQFYFNYALQIGANGHVYYPGTPYGLSSVCQPPFWRVRRVLERHRYLAGLSIDIGRWHASSDELGGGGVADAIATPPLQLAQETWRQVLYGFGPGYARRLRAPSWYHVDDSLTWDPVRGHFRNAAPFLINRPEEWEKRPGAVLREVVHDFGGSVPPGWDEAEVERAWEMHRQLPAAVWHRPAWGQWLLAGTFMKTHTRMTTMEAANESARHAVNGILNHLASRDPTSPDAPPSAGVLMGDYCPVWDPEDNEVEDLAPLRRLDERLWERGHPHVAEILQLERFAATPGDHAAADRVRGIMEATRDLGGGAPTGGGWMVELERELKRWLSW